MAICCTEASSTDTLRNGCDQFFLGPEMIGDHRRRRLRLDRNPARRQLFQGMRLAKQQLAGVHEAFCDVRSTGHEALTSTQ